jgi:hypothetical protein
MRLVKYILTFIATLYLGAVLFMPKSNLYYKAEELLNKQGVVIDNEEVRSSLINLKIMHPVAYYQGVDFARASMIKVTPLLFINTLEAENIELLSVAKKFLNISITTLKANHTILNPFNIKLNIVGNFGTASGYIDLKEKVIHIDIIEPKDINSIKKFLKKGKKGWYYESKF